MIDIQFTIGHVDRLFHKPECQLFARTQIDKCAIYQNNF